MYLSLGVFTYYSTIFLCWWWYSYCASENSGTPKSSTLIGFSIINHPFWGTLIFGNTHIVKTSYLYNKDIMCIGRPWTGEGDSFRKSLRFFLATSQVKKGNGKRDSPYFSKINTKLVGTWTNPDSMMDGLEIKSIRVVKYLIWLVLIWKIWTSKWVHLPQG